MTKLTKQVVREGGSHGKRNTGLLHALYQTIRATGAWRSEVYLTHLRTRRPLRLA